jgi:hypothetical protein
MVFYIPKTSRRMISSITNQNFLECKTNKLPVFDIIKFEVRSGCQTFAEFEKLAELNRQQSLIHFRATSFIVSKKVKSSVFIQDPQLEEFRRTREKKKTSVSYKEPAVKLGMNVQELIEEFLKMTDLISNMLEFTVHTFLLGEEQWSRTAKFVEKKVWMNIIHHISF